MPGIRPSLTAPSNGAARQLETDRGPRARRQREVAWVRMRILDAAETQLQIEGYDGLSMRKVADAIEYAPSSLYGYFRDKRAVLEGVLGRTADRLAEAMAPAVQTTHPIHRLQLLGLAYVRFALDQPRLYTALLATIQAAQPPLPNPLQQRAARYFAAAISEGVGCAALREVPTAEAAEAYWAACHGLVTLILGQGEGRSPAQTDKLIETMLNMQVDGLGNVDAPLDTRDVAVAR